MGRPSKPSYNPQMFPRQCACGACELCDRATIRTYDTRKAERKMQQKTDDRAVKQARTRMERRGVGRTMYKFGAPAEGLVVLNV